MGGRKSPFLITLANGLYNSLWLIIAVRFFRHSVFWSCILPSCIFSHYVMCVCSGLCRSDNADLFTRIGHEHVGMIMLICTLALVMNIIVLNIYHRSSNTHSVPNWVRVFNVERIFSFIINVLYFVSRCKQLVSRLARSIMFVCSSRRCRLWARCDRNECEPMLLQTGRRDPWANARRYHGQLSESRGQRSGSHDTAVRYGDMAEASVSTPLGGYCTVAYIFRQPSSSWC